MKSLLSFFNLEGVANEHAELIKWVSIAIFILIYLVLLNRLMRIKTAQRYSWSFLVGMVLYGLYYLLVRPYVIPDWDLGTQISIGISNLLLTGPIVVILGLLIYDRIETSIFITRLARGHYTLPKLGRRKQRRLNRLKQRIESGELEKINQYKRQAASDRLGWALREGSSTVLSLIEQGTDFKSPLSSVGTAQFGKRGANALPIMFMRDHGWRNTLYLIELGVDFNVKDDRGRTPFMLAAAELHAEILHLMLDRGADPRAIDNEGQDALFHYLAKGGGNFTAQEGRRIMATLLKFCDVNRTDAEGHTPLMQAVKNKKSVYIVEALIKAGANLDARDNSGMTALDHAYKNSVKKSARILESARTTD